MLEAIPRDPGSPDYLLGNTLGPDRRFWRRAKIGRRFRLFFRFDSRAKIIVYAWVNDTGILRQAGGKTDVYTVFKSMLARGNPPDSWGDLLSESAPLTPR